MSYPGFISGLSVEEEEKWYEGMANYLESFEDEAEDEAMLEPSLASSSTLTSLCDLPKIVLHEPEAAGESVIFSSVAKSNVHLDGSCTAPISSLASDDPLANSSSASPANSTVPPVLPPSVEMAYKKKCVELKRRMNEVEESNDVLRLRKIRLQRTIRKIRLERAILLDALDKRLHKNGEGPEEDFDYDSVGSSEEPPTPQEKPLRSKKSHRRPVGSPPPTLPLVSTIAAPSSSSTANPPPTHTNGTSISASTLPPLPNQADDTHTFAPPTASRRHPLEAPKEAYEMFSDYLQSDHMPREKQVDAADMKDWISMQWESLPDAVRAAWKQKHRNEWAEYQKEEVVASLGQRREERVPRDEGEGALIGAARSNNAKGSDIDREDVAMGEASGDRGEGL